MRSRGPALPGAARHVLLGDRRYRTARPAGNLSRVAPAAEQASLSTVIARAFPGALAADVRACASIITAAQPAPSVDFTVRAGDDTLFIPYRICNDEPEPGALATLAPRARVIARCVYTRHHDGHVRQRNLEQILPVTDHRVTAYVVQLAGEYVIEITAAIRAAFSELATAGTPHRAAYGRFAAANPGFTGLARARAISYWNQCYRRQYPVLASYPGHAFFAELKAAAREHAATARAGRGTEPGPAQPQAP